MPLAPSVKNMPLGRFVCAQYELMGYLPVPAYNIR